MRNCWKWLICLFGGLMLAIPVCAWSDAQDAKYALAYKEMIQKGRHKPAQKAMPTPAPAKTPAQGLFDGSFRKRLLLGLVKHHTIKKLMSEGTGKPGAKPLSRSDAEAAWKDLETNHADLIDGAIAEASPDAAAQVQAVGGPLTNFLDWLSTHQDQIMAIVKLIISIIALFGGGGG